MIIRKAVYPDAAGIASVHIESWKNSYKHIVQDSYLAAMDLNDRID
ncbi:hypothetical protein V1498_09865 [Peribacillus sp. SCS-26]